VVGVVFLPKIKNQPQQKNSTITNFKGFGGSDERSILCEKGFSQRVACGGRTVGS
jgi:hypothetical protein